MSVKKSKAQWLISLTVNRQTHSSISGTLAVRSVTRVLPSVPGLDIPHKLLVTSPRYYLPIWSTPRDFCRGTGFWFTFENCCLTLKDTNSLWWAREGRGDWKNRHNRILVPLRTKTYLVLCLALWTRRPWREAPLPWLAISATQPWAPTDYPGTAYWSVPA